MIFFSSDPEFKSFHKKFLAQGLKIDLLVTESPKKQGRNMTLKPNPAYQYAIDQNLKVKFFDSLDQKASDEIKELIGADKLGFIFAYGKIIPQKIIDLFENGILNIHFSLLPEYPGASPIQQALLDSKDYTGYTIFEITKNLDQGKLLYQKKILIKPDDTFDSLRSRIIEQATTELPELIKKYLSNEIKLGKMPSVSASFTRKISKKDGLVTNDDSAKSAYNKFRAYSRWPKTYIMIDNKRFIVHEARLIEGKLEILKIQPEDKKVMDFRDFANGYSGLLTKLPSFVKIN